MIDTPRYRDIMVQAMEDTAQERILVPPFHYPDELVEAYEAGVVGVWQHVATVGPEQWPVEAS